MRRRIRLRMTGEKDNLKELLAQYNSVTVLVNAKHVGESDLEGNCLLFNYNNENGMVIHIVYTQNNM